jgi:hypothetical protein
MATKLLPAALLALCACLACGGNTALTTRERLQKSVTRYNQAVRWNNPDVAAGYLPLAERAAYLEEHSRPDAAAVVDYDIESVTPDFTNEIAVVVVRFDWQDPDSITIRTTRIRQVWKLAEQEWVLHSRAEVKERKGGGKPAPLAPEKRF